MGGPFGKIRETVTDAAESFASSSRASLTAAVVIAAAALVVALIALGITVRRPRLA